MDENVAIFENMKKRRRQHLSLGRGLGPSPFSGDGVDPEGRVPHDFSHTTAVTPMSVALPASFLYAPKTLASRATKACLSWCWSVCCYE